MILFGLLVLNIDNKILFLVVLYKFWGVYLFEILIRVIDFWFLIIFNFLVVMIVNIRFLVLLRVILNGVWMEFVLCVFMIILFMFIFFMIFIFVEVYKYLLCDFIIFDKGLNLLGMVWMSEVVISILGFLYIVFSCIIVCFFLDDSMCLVIYVWYRFFL